jgi:RimJ/RimL family protein N-acetyltransferase
MLIPSQRLHLVPMTPAFLESSLAGDRAEAERQIGLTIPDDWWEEADLMRLRLGDLRGDPALQPWLVRAIGLRATGQMVGHIGFHDRPGAAHLEALAPGAVEMGYAVFAPFRRQGYAREAILALMGWARSEHRVARFVVSISPSNLPSLELARRLGFTRIGAHVDEVDGPEDIFLLET